MLDITYMILLMMNMFNSFIFMLMKHPLSMGLMLLIQTTLLSLFIGLMTKTFWFSYILFLIFIGGMLVLFIYVTSLASNEMFKPIPKMSMLMMMLFLNLLFFMLFTDKNIILNYTMNYETYMFSLMNKFSLENSLTLNKLYNFPMNLITITLMIFLFITLIAIVKITNVFEGPLRPKFTH